MQKSKLYFLGLLTLFGFPLVGFIVIYILEEKPLEFTLPHHWNFLSQIILGLCSGTIASLVAWKIVQLKFLKATRLKYGNLIQQFNMNIWDMIFISICAGIGEELLFRGALQPYLGIYITSVIFVAIHGYLNPKDWRITIYGIFMTLVIIGFGYMTEIAGILSAIVAHFTVDLILLLLIHKKKSPYELD